MPRRAVPKYSLHKASGQAFVRIAGKNHYLGTHGSPDSHKRYSAALADWFDRQDKAPEQVDLGRLCLLYLEFAKKRYRKNGKPTSQLVAIQSALRYLTRDYRKLPAAELTPRILKAVRAKMVAAGLARPTVNSMVGKIRRAVRWAVGEELVPASVLTGLEAVGNLRRHEAAYEPDPVRPVPLARVEAIRDFVAAPVWGAIQFQLLTGARPGEALTVRGCDLDTTGAVWIYEPQFHKTEHHGRQRIICIGPQAQEIVRQYLDTRLEAYLFGTPKSDGLKPYRRDSYTNAISRGCERAFGMPEKLRKPDKYLDSLDDLTDQQRAKQRRELLDQAAAWRAEHCWSPNQLRHTFATRARKEFGIEAARVTLGHSSAAVTELYAERDIEAACAVAAKIG